VPQAKDAAEVAALLGEAATLFGADAAAFASFVKDDESYESYRFVLACDARWCMEYEGGAHYMHDPWLEYARHHAEPVLAEHVHVRTPTQQAVVRLAAQFGFTSAVIIPAHSPQGLTRLGALCLGSAQHGYFASEGVHAMTVAAMPLAMRLHDWQIGTLRKELQARARLTDDDIALLHLERQGKGSKQIAAAMNTTSTSIDSRWQRLNAKLGVSTRQAASRLAAEYGLV
jgi:DNA-binding CsgD family transcriptional regulator